MCCLYLNRSPIRIVRDKIPQEAWSGKHHCVSHFRVFSCIAYAHVPKEVRSKLDNKSEKSISIGYNEQSKAYKLFNPISKKLIVILDVIFKEDESWDISINKTIVGTPTISRDEQEGKDQENEEDKSNEKMGSPSRSLQRDNTQMGDEPGDYSSIQVSNDSNPKIAQLRSRHKARRLEVCKIFMIKKTR